MREIGGTRFAGQHRMEAVRMGLPAGPAGREAQPIPGQPVGVTMAVEEVRLAGSFEDVGMGVELAEKVRVVPLRAAPMMMKSGSR